MLAPKYENTLSAYLRSLHFVAHSDTLYIVQKGPFSQIRSHIMVFYIHGANSDIKILMEH